MTKQTQTHVFTETAADENQSFAVLKDIEAALKPYIDAAKTGDGDLSRSAFFDHAHIVGSYSGAYAAEPADVFCDAVNAMGPAPKIQHHIAWIDVSGPAAAARVEFIDWAGNRFTDFFVLYCNDGAWKISGKVYHSHTHS